MPTSSSQKQYLTTYLGLIKKVGNDDLKNIFKHIKESQVKETTKLSYLNSIISLKKMDASLVKGDLTDIKDYRDTLGMKIEKGRDENNTNERQTKALDKVSLDDLHNFVAKLDSEKNKSNKDMDNYVLVKLMTTYPVRNDLQEILLTKIKRDLDHQVNSLFIPNGKGKPSILSIKEYKTSRSNGDIKINIDGDLSDDIRKLIKDGRQYLFVNTKNEPLSSSSFTHKLNKLFMKEFDVPISSTILRKIYLTGKYGKVADDMERDSHIMGHDIGTQRKIYIKKKNGKIDVNPTGQHTEKNEEE